MEGYAWGRSPAGFRPYSSYSWVEQTCGFLGSCEPFHSLMVHFIGGKARVILFVTGPKLAGPY